MRSAALLAVVLAVPAGAQPWSATPWTVLCVTGLGTLERCENIESPTTRLPLGDAAAFYEDQLRRSSAWLEGLGFPAPHFASLTADGEYFATIQREGFGSETIALYKTGQRPSGQAIAEFIINRDALLVPDLLTPDYFEDHPEIDRSDPRTFASSYGTVVHELFHAVQAGIMGIDRYQRSGKQVGGGPNAEGRQWIFEGAAGAVQYAWLRHSPVVAGADHDSGAAREYSDPLYDPQWGYETEAFWTAVGRMIGSRDAVAYLRGVFEQEIGDANGVAGVHAALTEHHPDGLAHYFPRFIAEQISDPVYFDAVEEAEAVEGGEVRVEGTVAPLAAERVTVIADLTRGADEGTLTIELEGPDGLSLVVNDQLLRPGRTWSMTLSAAIPGVEVPVRVVNIADTPETTTAERYTLIVTYEEESPEIAECGSGLPPGVSFAITDNGPILGGSFSLSHTFEPTTYTRGSRTNTIYEDVQRMVFADRVAYSWMPDPDAEPAGPGAMPDGLNYVVSEMPGDSRQRISFNTGGGSASIATSATGVGTFPAQIGVGFPPATGRAGVVLGGATVTVTTVDAEGCIAGSFFGGYEQPTGTVHTVEGTFLVAMPRENVIDIDMRPSRLRSQ